MNCTLRGTLALAGAWSAGRADAGASPPEQPIEDAITVTHGVCLSLESLGKAFRAWRGRVSVARRIHFVVREQPESKQVQILVLRDGASIGNRSFDVGDRQCEEVTRMVALSIAVTLDQLLLSDPLERPPADEGRVHSEAIEAAPTDVRSAERNAAKPALGPLIRRIPEETRTWRLVVTAPQTDVAVGILPEIGIGLSAGAGVRYGRHIQGVVYGKALHSQPATFGPGSLETSLVLARAEGCFRQRLRPPGVRAAACASLAYGALRGESFGFADARADALSYWAAGVGGKVELALLPKVALVLAGEVVFPLAAPQFDLVSRGGTARVTWKPPAAGLLVSIGPQFEF